MLSVGYWHKVARLGDAEQTAHDERQRRFRETSDLAVLEGQTMHDGLFMMSVENEERCTAGGAVCAIPFKLIGCKLADKTHRRATAQEIEEMHRQQESRKALSERAEDAINRRRTVHLRAVEPQSRRSA